MLIRGLLAYEISLFRESADVAHEITDYFMGSERPMKICEKI
jgi:hypothetical protein